MKRLLSLSAATCLLVASAAAQGADDCANATPIAGFNQFSFDNTSATGSGLTDCNGLGVRKDVWFSWTAPQTGLTRFETCGTNTAFDTRIAVYDGTDCNNLNLITCIAGNCMGLSRVSFDAVAGQSYLLRVGSRLVGVGGPGQFVMSLDPCPTSLDDTLENNDDCASAVALGDGVYNNLWCSKADADWYSFCVPAGGTLTMDVFFTELDGDIDIFALDACTAPQTSLGIGGSATDDEQIVYMNAGTTDQQVFLRVELWADDPTQDCNDYSMMITGSTGSCSPGGGFGTAYCMANPNSTGATAMMSATGSDVAADNNLTLVGSGLPVNAFGFFITALGQAQVNNPGGSSGNLCLGGAIGRYVGAGQIQQAGANGTISLMIDLNQIPQPNGFVSVSAGDTWNFQAWYRDSSSTGATSNFTRGLELTFQ